MRGELKARCEGYAARLGQLKGAFEGLQKGIAVGLTAIDMPAFTDEPAPEPEPEPETERDIAPEDDRDIDAEPELEVDHVDELDIEPMEVEPIDEEEEELSPPPPPIPDAE